MILTLRDKKCRISTFCVKKCHILSIFWAVSKSSRALWANLSLLNTFWAMSKSLVSHLSHMWALSWEIGSQDPCSARTDGAAVQHFPLLCVWVSTVCFQKSRARASLRKVLRTRLYDYYASYRCPITGVVLQMSKIMWVKFKLFMTSFGWAFKC